VVTGQCSAYNGKNLSDNRWTVDMRRRQVLFAAVNNKTVRGAMIEGITIHAMVGMIVGVYAMVAAAGVLLLFRVDVSSQTFFHS